MFRRQVEQNAELRVGKHHLYRRIGDCTPQKRQQHQTLGNHHVDCYRTVEHVCLLHLQFFHFASAFQDPKQLNPGKLGYAPRKLMGHQGIPRIPQGQLFPGLHAFNPNSFGASIRLRTSVGDGTGAASKRGFRRLGRKLEFSHQDRQRL